MSLACLAIHSARVYSKWSKFILSVFLMQVQVGRLGRSKPLNMSAYEVTSTSCVVETKMLSDSTRW